MFGPRSLRSRHRPVRFPLVGHQWKTVTYGCGCRCGGGGCVSVSATPRGFEGGKHVDDRETAPV